MTIDRSDHARPSAERREQRPIGRRGFLGWGASLAGAGLLLAACRSAPAGPPAATTGPAATSRPAAASSPVAASPAVKSSTPSAATETPKSGGTLTLASPEDVANFNPFYLVQDNTLSQRALYDSLILYDSQASTGLSSGRSRTRTAWSAASNPGMST